MTSRKPEKLFVQFVAICMALLISNGMAQAQTANAGFPEIPVEAFFKQDRLVEMKISPNGEYLAATVALPDRTDLIFLSQGEKGVKLMGQTGIGAKQHVSSFDWVSPTRIAFRTAKQSGKLSRPVIDTWTHFINADGSKHIRVEAANILDTFRDQDNSVLVTDNHYVFYLNTNDGNLVDSKIESPKSQRGQFFTDNSGMVRFFKTLRKKDITSSFYELDLNTREWKLIDAQYKTGRDIHVLGFSDNDTRAYLSIGQPAGPAQVYVQDLKTGQREALYKDDNVDPAGAYQSPVDGSLIALRFLDGKPRMHIVKTDDIYAKDLVKIEQSLPGKSFYPTSYTADGNLAVIHAYNDKSPGDFLLYNRKAQTLVPLFELGEAMSTDGLSSMRPVKFNARDGLELEAFLTTPENRNGKNLPMVLYVHGGPFGIFDKWEFDPQVQLLANRGYAVLQVNYRGSGNYGESFEEKGYQQWGKAMQDDLTDATRWAIKEGIADPQRICIYGASYGGYAALMGAVREPTLYACAIGNIGVYDLPQIFKDDRGENWFTDKYFSRTLGTADLEKVSPSMRAQEIKIPVLLGAGREDETAPPLHTERMRDALLKAGGSVESVFYEGEDHGNYLLKNQVDWAERVLRFLDRNIGKASQAGK